MLIQLIRNPELIEAKIGWLLKNLSDVLPVDIANFLSNLRRYCGCCISFIKKSTAADVFAEMPSGKGVELIELFTKQQLTDVMGSLEPDEQVALLEELPQASHTNGDDFLKPVDQKQVKKLLGYQRIVFTMTPRYVRVKSEWAVLLKYGTY